MLLTRQQLKERARKQLSGNYLIMILINLIVGAIISAASSIAIGSLIVGGPLAIQLVFYAKDMAYGNKPKIENIVNGFKLCFEKSMVNYLLVSLFTFLWSLLFLIPGIVKSYAYSFSMYIQADDFNMSPSDCIKKSMEMTKGHKLNLFILELSFIGWILLSILTFGILLLWIAPYMSQTHYNYYLMVKENLEKSNPQPQAQEPLTPYQPS